jgi:ABC-2 type transport system ATP-binding protein
MIRHKLPHRAGKTSTLNAIEGLLTPLSGAVLVDGVNVRENPGGARQRLGRALHATGFLPELTVSQILRLYAGLYEVRPTRAQVAARLCDAGLNAVSGRRVKQLPAASSSGSC